MGVKLLPLRRATWAPEAVTEEAVTRSMSMNSTLSHPESVASGGLMLSSSIFLIDFIELIELIEVFFVKIGGGDKFRINFCSILCVFGGV